ncbi:MAG: hypothetical protein GX558_08980 [Clostridiales bacterium]|nr:hypothetical protein [Clostridiales bacterium]
MTARERFRAMMRFEPVDRMPMVEWATWWDATVDNWKAQGLTIAPAPGLSEGEALHLTMGLDLHLQYWFGFRSAATPHPAYHGAPLAADEAEYERLRPTLFPKDEIDRERLRTYARYQAEGAIVWITLEGPFWGPRTVLGIQNHLMAFYDQPELMHRINRDIAEYNLWVLDEVCKILTPDFMTIAEDMSYNLGPMLSEAMFDEFMLPYYHMLVPALKERGIRVFVDSDGDIERALPWFARAGVEGILPLERQAGVDLMRLRQQFPKFLFIGHFDKMTMPRGEAAMRAEFERLLPVMRQGGFVAGVDHQTPPGVTLDNYRIYLKLLAEYARKAGDRQ